MYILLVLFCWINRSLILILYSDNHEQKITYLIYYTLNRNKMQRPSTILNNLNYHTLLSNPHMFYGQNFRTSHFPHTFVALRADQQGEIQENRINLVCKVRPQANSRCIPSNIVNTQRMQFHNFIRRQHDICSMFFGAMGNAVYMNMD